MSTHILDTVQCYQLFVDSLLTIGPNMRHIRHVDKCGYLDKPEVTCFTPDSGLNELVK